MKKILSILFIISSFTFVNAQESRGWYLGAGLLTGSGTHANEQTNDLSNNVTATTSGTTFKLGFDDINARTEISYTSIDLTNDSDSSDTANFYGFDLDTVRLFSDKGLKPYLTVGLGYHYWDGFSAVNSSGDTVERSAITLNYGIGALYLLTKNIELDVSYKGKYYMWQDVEYTTYTLSSTTTLMNLSLGLNFRF